MNEEKCLQCGRKLLSDGTCPSCNPDNYCCECVLEEAKYIYKGKKYCSDCLLEKLAEDKKIETWTVNHYMVNDEYVGNDNDNYMEDVTENIAKSLKIKKME